MTTNKFEQGAIISINGEVSVVDSYNYTLENKPAVKLLVYGRPSLYTIVPVALLDKAQPSNELEGHACFLRTELAMAKADLDLFRMSLEEQVEKRRQLHAADVNADLTDVNAKIERHGKAITVREVEVARLGEELEVAELAVKSNENKGSVVEMMNMTKDVLKDLAKIAGVVGYSRMNKAELVTAIQAKTVKVEFVSQEEANKNEEVVSMSTNQEVVLGSLDDAISLEAVVENAIDHVLETPVVDVPVHIVCESEIKSECVLPVGTYVKNLKNGRYYRVNSYARKTNGAEVAKLIFKLKATDKLPITVELPVAHLNNKEVYAVATAADVKAYYAGGANPAPKTQTPVVPANQQGMKDFRKDVSVGYDAKSKDFYITNLNNGTKGYVSKDKSVENLLKSYETTIQGLKVTVTQTRKAVADLKAKAPVVNKPKHVCFACKEEVSDHVHNFLSLAKSQAKLPTRFQGKDYCYSCQVKLGMVKLLKSPDARATVNLNGQQQLQ